jgi:hypothetical protein
MYHEFLRSSTINFRQTAFPKSPEILFQSEDVSQESKEIIVLNAKERVADVITVTVRLRGITSRLARQARPLCLRRKRRSG